MCVNKENVADISSIYILIGDVNDPIINFNQNPEAGVYGLFHSKKNKENLRMHLSDTSFINDQMYNGDTQNTNTF